MVDRESAVAHRIGDVAECSAARARRADLAVRLVPGPLVGMCQPPGGPEPVRSPRQVAGIETVFIVTGESFAYTSSSLIKQIAALGGSLDALATLVPPAVIDALRAKRRDPSNPIGKLARDGLVE